MRAEIRSGNARRERKLAICAGNISLAPADRAELLTVLAADADPAVAERAAGALLTQPGESFLAALERTDAAPQLLLYCARNLAAKPGVADALAKNPACPAALLAHVAAHLSAAGIQALLENLDRLVSVPALIGALTASPVLTLEQRGFFEELQKGAAALGELAEAVEAAEPDFAKRQTLLQRLSHLTVVERVHLALRGNREERIALIRDPNKIVQRAVLQSPRLTELEVESFAAMTTLPAEILRVIALNRAFIKSYTIARNLVANSKTPLDISLRLLARLTARDLKLLTTNKNIPDTLRTNALKLHRQRSESRQGS